MENSKIKNYHAKLDRSLLSRDRVRSSEDDHYMEFVDEIRDVVYINDSRSTGISATHNSIEAVEAPVVLITGGDDRDNDYSVLARLTKQKIVAVVYLGADSNKILQHFSTHSILFAKAYDLKEAVAIAGSYSKQGDVVLFSPACPSYHEHDNYKNRGNEFKSLVKRLIA
jgi:UDP-N-acetylmuramoylalanine--D-glutamate ligase